MRDERAALLPLAYVGVKPHVTPDWQTAFAWLIAWTEKRYDGEAR